MPSVPVVSGEDYIKALKKQTTIFDDDGYLLPKTHQVWRDVSKDLENKMSRQYAWQRVHENRSNSQAELRVHHGLPPLPSSNEDERDSPHENDDGDFEDESTRLVLPKKHIPFVIEIDPEIWSKIKPVPVDQFRSDRSSKNRTVLQFQEGWGAKLHDLFFNQHQLPCSFTLKAQINKDPTISSAYIVILGECKECGNMAEGRILFPPDENQVVCFKWKSMDTRGVAHKKRRPLSGSRRKEFGQDCQNLDPCVFQRNVAAKSMEFGDVIPPNLPNLGTIRKAKQETNDKTLNVVKGVEEIAKICHMKRTAPHAGSIHEIGADPVFVNYDTQEQMLLYKSYSSIFKYTRLTGDATGSLAERVPLMQPLKGLSSHLFLYELVISGEVQIPIAQMISEKHDTVKITSWLMDWVRRGGKPPNEFVCDSSLALLGAAARVFGECHTLKEYIEMQFKSVLDPSIEPAPVFIRKDVAHMIKNVTKWKVWDEDIPRLKDFYVRCFALLIQCTSFTHFGNVLCNIVTAALSDTTGSTEDGPVPSEECVDMLSKEIRNAENFDVDSLLKEEPKHEHQLSFDVPEEEVPENVKEWVLYVQEEANNRSAIKGPKNSGYFAPKVAKRFLECAQDFVLWSAVLVKAYKSPFLRASSAASESDFNDLKNRVLRSKRPLKLEKLILHHLNSINGQTKLAAAKLSAPRVEEDVDNDLRTVSNATEQPSSTDSPPPVEEDEPLSTLELNQRENWKDLADKGRKSKTKYFEPSSESRLAQEVGTLKPPKERMLKNGSLLKPLTMDDGQMLALKNTCNIDSLCQMIASAYIEQPKVRGMIDDSTSLLLQAAKLLATKGAVRETYLMRAKTAQQLCTEHNTTAVKGSLTRSKRAKLFSSFDCRGKLNDQAELLLALSPAVSVSKRCLSPRCKEEARHITVLLRPDDITMRDNGLTSLQAACEITLQRMESRCKAAKCKEATVTTTELSPIIFLDVSFMLLIPDLNAGNLKNSCELKSIPSSLQLKEKKFQLCGVLVYQPSHLVAYTIRGGNRWEKLDDLRNGPMRVISESSVNPLLLCYTIV